MAVNAYGDYELIARNLGYPEGPVWLDDGSVLLVEIRFEVLSRVTSAGQHEIVARLAGGPNGAALGPDGKVFICNDGGFEWIPVPLGKQRLYIGGNQPQDYRGGAIQTVDLASGEVDTVYTHCDSWADMTGFGERKPQIKPLQPPFDLRGPDDLVFDASGGFWFSDFGKSRPRDKDITGIYYASADGSKIQLKAFPLNSPNGIALSPDGKRLYAALTYERTVLYWKLGDPGEIIPNPHTMDGSYLLTAELPGRSILDSMAVDSAGNVHVATMLPKGNDPMSNGGITVISADGRAVEFHEITLDGAYAPLPSNLCFGGKDMKTAYITCGASGLLVKSRVEVPGLRLAYPQG